jgi:hypothetical protein
MDPNANLARQRELSQEILTIVDQCSDDGEFTEDQELELVHLAANLAEHVQALDEWITRGGFLPEGWAK